MFNNAKIRELEQRIKYLQESIDDLIWEKHNPPKFKKGDKVKNYKVYCVNLQKKGIFNRLEWVYSLFNLKTNDIINYSEELLLKIKNEK